MNLDLGPYRSCELVIPRRQSFWSWFRSLWRRAPVEPRVWHTHAFLGSTIHVRARGYKANFRLYANMGQAARRCRLYKSGDLSIQAEGTHVYIIPECVAQQTAKLIILLYEAES